MPIEHGRIVRFAYARLQSLIEKSQARQGNSKTSRCDDMIDFHLLIVPALLSKSDAHLVINDASTRESRAEVHGYMSDRGIADEPAGRGSEVALHYAMTQRFGQRMKRQWNIRAHARSPAHTQT